MNVLYFDDNYDFATALWQILNITQGRNKHDDCYDVKLTYMEAAEQLTAKELEAKRIKLSEYVKKIVKLNNDIEKLNMKHIAIIEKLKLEFPK